VEVVLGGVALAVVGNLTYIIVLSINTILSFVIIMLGFVLKTSKSFIFVYYLEIIYLRMIQVSDTAKKKIAELMSDDGFNVANDFVRVGVKSGGCSGLSYELKFDKSKADEDKVFEDNAVKIIVDKKSFLYLVGTILEYSGGLNGKGFVFNNPNAQRTCGCGESFSL
jgi:iron-sulfur cluster assembly protein